MCQHPETKALILSYKPQCTQGAAKAQGAYKERLGSDVTGVKVGTLHLCENSASAVNRRHIWIARHSRSVEESNNLSCAPSHSGQRPQSGCLTRLWTAWAVLKG